MKNLLKRTAAVITFLFSTQISNAQEITNENSLLWEISGNGLEKPSYLYGTMHMMCEADFLMSDKVKTAFDKTEQLALELDFDNPEELQAMQNMMKTNEPLSKVLTKEEYKKLDEFLIANIGSGAAQFENSNLMGIMSTVMMKSLNCPPKMYEIEFMKMAFKKKFTINGLETVQDQIDSFSKSYSNAEFIKSLSQYDAKILAQMVKVYNEENINKLFEIITDDTYMDEKSQASMLDKRNTNWIKIMPEMMKTKSVFFAVGAGHLPGEMGVINLLKKAGYIVKPILK